MAGRSPGNKKQFLEVKIMTVFLEHKVVDGCYPFNELYTDISKCDYYFAHGKTYLKLYKNNSEFNYDFCIDLSDVKEFLIKN